ncbi:helix-turn-helix transcriptional regulator [Eionea flava]
MFESYDTDAMVLQSIGRRIADNRLDANMTQARLAEEAGVSKRTIERLESGESIQLANLIRVLRVQGKLPLLEEVFPEPAISPLQQLKIQSATKKVRKRAYPSTRYPPITANPANSESTTREINEPRPDQQWQWGDE